MQTLTTVLSILLSVLFYFGYYYDSPSRDVVVELKCGETLGPSPVSSTSKLRHTPHSESGAYDLTYPSASFETWGPGRYLLVSLNHLSHGNARINHVSGNALCIVDKVELSSSY
jgi:hypothetical protein